MTITSSDDNYFVFEDMLADTMSALSRDPWLVNNAAVFSQVTFFYIFIVICNFLLDVCLVSHLQSLQSLLFHAVHRKLPGVDVHVMGWECTLWAL